ncbi:MAG: hypothetical protein HOP15_06305, partial [Planctomycetes bacterium]|nr:hypothetical protein [Planctomycetota bacterium]
LAELARVLAPGGRLLLDLMNPARVKATLVPESRTRRGALEIHERRHLEGGGTRVVRVVKDVHVQSDDGGERRWREDVRLYEPDELDLLLAQAGFGRLRREGDFDGQAFRADSPRQIVWAQRGALASD